MQKSLKDFKIGESGKVVSVDGERTIKRRLFDMGVTPNTKITLRKRAPFGDPLEVTLRGYELTLRKNEAEKIIMEMEVNA